MNLAGEAASEEDGWQPGREYRGWLLVLAVRGGGGGGMGWDGVRGARGRRGRRIPALHAGWRSSSVLAATPSWLQRFRGQAGLSPLLALLCVLCRPPPPTSCCGRAWRAPRWRRWAPAPCWSWRCPPGTATCSTQMRSECGALFLCLPAALLAGLRAKYALPPEPLRVNWSPSPAPAGSRRVRPSLPCACWAPPSCTRYTGSWVSAGHRPPLLGAPTRTAPQLPGAAAGCVPPLRALRAPLRLTRACACPPAAAVATHRLNTSAWPFPQYHQELLAQQLLLKPRRT